MRSRRRRRLQRASRQVVYPLTHDVRKLLQLCAEVDKDLASAVAPAAGLTQFAVRFRYPGEDQPTREEALPWLELARLVCAEVRHEVVLGGDLVGIVENFDCRLERDSVVSEVLLSFGRVLCESRLHITVSYIRSKNGANGYGRVLKRFGGFGPFYVRQHRSLTRAAQQVL